MNADITANIRLVTRAITNRRQRLADSGLDDRHTKALIYVLDHIYVTAGRNDITVSVLPTPATRGLRRTITAALHAALDAVDGTTEQIDDHTVRLHLPANR